MRHRNIRRRCFCKESPERLSCSICLQCDSRTIVGEVTGQPVVVYQRIDQAGQRLPIDERMLADTDTLMVFGLDHMITEQEAAPEEIEALKQFLTREGTCLLIGSTSRCGRITGRETASNGVCPSWRSAGPSPAALRPVHAILMKGLGVPVENRFGLRPAVVKGTNQIAPLTAMRDLDTHGWLANVPTFNFHQHLPHYALTTDDTRCNSCAGPAAGRFDETASVHRSRKHRIQLFLWMPPAGTRAGHILLADLTIFTTLVWRRREPRQLLVQPRDKRMKHDRSKRLRCST